MSHLERSVIIIVGPYEDCVGSLCRLQQDSTGLVATGLTVCAACRESALHYTICETEGCQCSPETEQWYGGTRCETKLEEITTQESKNLDLKSHLNHNFMFLMLLQN